jgi:fucose 4-O-acetylase-like acetyltransferase
MTRNPYFDNAKAILMVLVVLGHTLSEMVEVNHWVASIYMFIYLFHMPAFILVSGYFAKKIKSKKDVWNLIKVLLLPYLLFQISYTLYYQKVYGDNIDFSLLSPRWALWFLVSLFCWDLLLMIFRKRKIGLLLAVLLSLAVGYIGEINETFALSRTFFYFPFYLFGYLLEGKHFEWIKKKTNVLVSWFVLGILLLFIDVYGNIEWREWLFARIPYEEIMDGSTTYGFLYRFLVYVLMAVATYCFLSIVPKKQLSMTMIGTHTMIIYLFHMFVIRYVHESYFYDWIEKEQQFYLLFIIPLIVVYLLTRKPVLQFGSMLLGIKLRKIND